MNKKKLEVESKQLRYDRWEYPPEIENKIKENIKTIFKNLHKYESKEWLPKEKKTMKKTKWQSIDIKQEVYNKLESYRAEWSADSLSQVIGYLIAEHEADDEQEDDRYYCENCGDYHD
jgi:hypothetical protein